MAKGKSKLDAMLDAFDAAYPGQGKAFAAILDDTPQLKARFIQAAEGGQLTGFDSTGADGDGVYYPNSGVIALPSDGLAGGSLATPDRTNLLRIIAGHEIGHALNRDDIQATNTQFQRDVDELAQRSGDHDYTGLLAQRGQLQRTRESTDEIHGINALAEYVREKNSRATLKDLYDASPSEMKSYIERTGSAPEFRYHPRGGLVFDDNLQIDPRKAENVEAMGKLFYDDRGYPQFYGERGLRIIAEAEAKAAKDNPGRAAPAVYADLPALAIDPSELAPSSLPAGFTATKAPAASHPPEKHAEGTHRLSVEDQTMDKHLRYELAQLEAGFGKPWDANSERMSASLSLLAARSGFTAADAPSVSFNNATGQYPAGSLVFLSREGDSRHCDPYRNRAHMGTAEALSAPADQSYEQLQVHREMQQRQANQQPSVDNLSQTQVAEQAQHRGSPGL